MRGASRSFFEALLTYVGDPVLLTRPDGGILRANPAACRALGRTEPEICALGRAGVIEASPELSRMLEERARLGATRGELRFRKADGSTFPADVTSTAVPVASGEPVTLVVFRDATERKQLLEALRESETRFRAAFDALPDAVSVTDLATGKFLLVNEGARLVTGWTPDELVGHGALERGLWADGDREEAVGDLLRDGVLRDFDTRLRRKDGSVIEVLLSARPLKVYGRDLLLTITRDVTRERQALRDRDAAQAQLRESQRLESLGRLAGGVAHDFNNLLTVILGCGGSLEEDLRRGATPDPEDLAELHAAAERARDLTRQLLAFARREVPSPVPLDVGATVQKMEKLLRRVLGEDVELLVGTPPEPRLVRCDPTQLEQVILNLAVNARDALPRGGKLLVEARNVTLDDRLLARFPGAQPGPHVLLVVQDNGVGMRAEVREHAFEPLFTTKGEGKGTGLGLATVYGIVGQAGGQIALESAPGLGTKVEILLPAVAGAPAAPQPRPPAGPGGCETVIVVEDDPRVREVACRILRQAGYRVLDAGTGEDALTLVAGESVDLVLSDVVMPALNGRQLADRLRERPAPPRMLFMSGHPQETVYRRGLLDPGTPLLAKPFTPAALLGRVREVLDAPR
ncbi:MAG: PAS domain S-box protein [Anaeromyxobacteraceae bacterium]